METKYQEVFKQYNFKIQGTFRIRGAHIIETNEGPKLFKRLECSINQVRFEDKIQQLLVKKGHPYVDLYVRNSNDEIITKDSMGDKYLIKNWNYGTECDLRKEEDVLDGVANLASIHKFLSNVSINEEELSYNIEANLHNTFEKRIKELRRVRSYIRRKRKKNEFEVCFLDCYDLLFDQAVLANKLLKTSQYDNLLGDAILAGNIYHGNYTYHNLITLDKNQNKQRSKYTNENSDLHGKQIVTTNFDKALVGIQINDLYHFLRKTMEKNDWDISFGDKMIETYNSNCKISKEEAEILYILLLYPEKFWKVSNHYYNGKKTWVPQRTTDKLREVKNQIRPKDEFLNQLKDKLNYE